MLCIHNYSPPVAKAHLPLDPLRAFCYLVPMDKPFNSLPADLLELVQAPASPVSAGQHLKRVDRKQYENHPLVVLVRAYAAKRAGGGRARSRRELAARTLEEYLGVISIGLAYGDLLVPLRAAATSSRFNTVAAALELTREAVAQIQGAAQGRDFNSLFGVRVDNLRDELEAVKGPKTVAQPKLSLSAEEWGAIIRLVAAHEKPPLRDVYLTLLVSGLRANDLLRVKRAEAEEVVQRGRTIIQQKGGRERPWTPEAAAIEPLRRLLGIRGWRYIRDLLVPDAPIEDVRALRAAYTRLYRGLQERIASAANLPEFHGTHTFRRTLAVQMLRKKVPPHVIQTTLGHKRPETTQRYTGEAPAEEVQDGIGSVMDEVLRR